MDELPPIAKNLVRLRTYRGMTLQQLADRTGLSVSYLSRLERGDRPVALESRRMQARLAEALEISVEELSGDRVAAPGLRQAHVCVPAVREALMETGLDDTLDVPMRDLDDLAQRVAEIQKSQRYADYASSTRALPEVLYELHALVVAGEQAAVRLLVTALSCTTFAARNLGYPDLAWIAAERCWQAALTVDDPVLAGRAGFVYAHARPSATRSRALARTGALADKLQPLLGDDRSVHEVYGMLHLSAALDAKVRDDNATADGRLAEAASVADRWGERRGAWQSFGPSNVLAWRVMLAVESGASAEALEHAERVDLAALGTRGRRAAVLIDTAHAHMQMGRTHTAQAVAALRQAERIAPLRVRHNIVARDIVSSMLIRARRDAGGTELRGMAYRMGLDRA